MKAAREIVRKQVSDATAAFLGGSFLRDEETPWSALDLVTVSNLRARPIRHNMVVDGWYVDLTVHTTETLLECLAEESSSGIPRLATLIVESVGLLETEQESELRRHANSVLHQGPPPLERSDSRERRFRITELVDDLRQPRSMFEVLASAGELYQEFANFILRSNGQWGARGKWTAREIERHDPVLAKTFEDAFLRLAREGHSDHAIDMVEEALEEHGGFLYDGYVRTVRTVHRGAFLAETA